MSRLSVLCAVLFLMISVIIFGCNREPAQEPATNLSIENVTQFLEGQYFEVPEGQELLEDFEYVLLNGSKESFSSNRGKVILLNFWATWCYPCKKEMPDMQALMDELKGKPFRILAVNYGENSEKVNRFIQKFNYSFDVVMDTDKTISSRLKIKGLPTTVLIDKNGRILGKLLGPANWSKNKFLEFFKTLSQNQQ